MSATKITHSKVSFPLSFYVLGVIALFGLTVGIYRLATSLGATTNLNQGYPWGLWIAFDIFTMPLSAGAFTLAAMLHIFNRKEYHGIAHLAFLAGFLGYLMIILVLLLDINRWDHFYNVLLPPFWNLHSFLCEAALCVSLYFGLSVILYFGALIFGRKNWLAVRVVPLLAGVGVLISIVHQNSAGAIFLTLSHRLDPLWWSPVIPLLFFTSALFSGLSVAGLLAILTWRALRQPTPLPLVQGLTRVAAYIMAAFLVLKFGDLALAGELGLMFSSGALSLVFWVEVILLIAAMVIYLRAGQNENALLTGTVCTLAWLALNRLTIAWFAQHAPAGATYFPSWIEIGVVAAAFLAGILFYALGVRYVPELGAGVVKAKTR